MDIATQAQIVLRQAGFETWPLTTLQPTVTCFESSSIIGFLHVFQSGTELLTSWEARQKAVLARYAPAFRVAGAKAWNVYSVLLAEAATPIESQAIAEIEENFSLTRKIARTGIQTQHDLEQALLPLRRIQSQPVVSESNFEARLRDQLILQPDSAIDALLGDADPSDVAQILEEGAL